MSAEVADLTPSSSLRTDAISSRHLVAFVVGAAAPLTVMAGFAPLAFFFGGQITPAGFLIAGAVYTIFAVGFTTMSRHVQNAGAFYAYITRGLGKVAGGGAALLAYAGYTLGEIGFAAASGLFASNTLESLAHITVPWGWCALVIGVVVSALSYGQVNIGARVLMVLLSCEIGVLLVLAVAVLIHGVPDGYSFAAFNPGNWSPSAMGSLFVITFVVYIGFEQTAIYSEEARDPRRTVPRATYLSVGLLAVIYTFISWVILMAIGPANLGKALSGDTATLVYDVNTRYVSTLMTDVMQILIVTSFLAGVLALHNAGSRYLFAMARERMLPQVLARADEASGSPRAACVLQSILVIAALIGFGLSSLDPYTQVVVWTNTPTLVAVLVLQIATSVAVIRYFARNARGERLWNRLIAPAIAAVLLAGALWLVISKIQVLTGLNPLGNFYILLPLIVAVTGGVCRAAYLTRTSGWQPQTQDTESAQHAPSPEGTQA